MHTIRKWEALFYIAIPVVMVILCRVLKVAQGETTEEIAFGIMAGICIDVLLAIVLFVSSRFHDT